MKFKIGYREIDLGDGFLVKLKPMTFEDLQELSRRTAEFQKESDSDQLKGLFQMSNEEFIKLVRGYFDKYIGEIELTIEEEDGNERKGTLEDCFQYGELFIKLVPVLEHMISGSSLSKEEGENLKK